MFLKRVLELSLEIFFSEMLLKKYVAFNLCLPKIIEDVV